MCSLIIRTPVFLRSLGPSSRPTRLQDDRAQALDRFLDLRLFEKTECGANIRRFCPVREEDRTGEGQNALLERLRPDEALRVLFRRALRARRLEEELEPVGTERTSRSRAQTRRKEVIATHQKNIPASGVSHCASPSRCFFMCRSNTSRLPL